MRVARASATGSPCGAASSGGSPTGSPGRRRRGGPRAAGLRPGRRSARRSVRRRHERRRRPVPGGPRAACGRRSSGPRRRPGADGRTARPWTRRAGSRRSGPASPGRRSRPRSGARPDPWSRAAVVGVLDARRLGRHPLVRTALARVRADRGALRRGRLESPAGTLELPTSPASAAGPDLRQLVLGSEGRLGILVEATVRRCPSPTTSAQTRCSSPTGSAGSRRSAS